MNAKTKQLIEAKNELCASFVTNAEAIERIGRMRMQKMENFHQYSYGNIVLASMELYFRKNELPELLGPYSVWEKVGRHVNRGEKSLSILVPMKGTVINCPVCNSPTYGKKIKNGCSSCGYKFTKEDLDEIKGFTSFTVRGIFDISQTSGEPLDPELIHGETDVRFHDLKLRCKYPVRFYSKHCSKGETDGKTIWISIHSSNVHRISTLVHEIAHIKLGHFQREFDRNLFELEAESVAYMVTSVLGLKNEKAAAYINSWVKDNPAQKIEDAEDLVQVAEEIMKELSLL